MIHGLKQRELIERTFGRCPDSKVAAELLQRLEALHKGLKGVRDLYEVKAVNI
jgi:hypothetical protein